MTTALPHPIAARFALIIAGLRVAVAIACGPPPPGGPLVLRLTRPLAANLAARLHGRLGKMMQAFTALVAHLTEFGADAPSRPPHRKPAPRPEAAASPAPDAPSDTRQTASWGATAAARPESPPRPPRLPGNVGWLTGLSPAAAAAASQLRHLLTDPDMLALLRASPALVQMLRPLCRMLRVDLPVEFLPPKPADAEPKPPRRRRRRLWRPPSRRSDMLSLVRMGTPLRESLFRAGETRILIVPKSKHISPAPPDRTISCGGADGQVSL